MPVFLPSDTRAATGTQAVGIGAGLRLDKYPILAGLGVNTAAARGELLAALCRAPVDSLAWKGASVFAPGADLDMVHVGLEGRLLINQSGGLVENSGLALHRTFGTPMIPGTAVKGIARAQAIRELATAPDAERDQLLIMAMIVFGYAKNDLRTGRRGDIPDMLEAYGWGRGRPDELPRHGGLGMWEEFGGTVAFLPSMPTTPVRIVQEILTPHHRGYYSQRNGDRVRPYDNEDPVPYAFPAVEVVGRESAAQFRFSLVRLPRWKHVKHLLCEDVPEGFDPLVQARAWLLAGLTQYGVGAKTAAGYGVMVFDADANVRRHEEADRQAKAEAAARIAAEREGARVASLSPEQRAAEEYAKALGSGDVVGAFKGKMAAIASAPETERRSICVLLRDFEPFRRIWAEDAKEAAKAENQPLNRREKNKGLKRVEAVRAVAKELGIKLP